MKHIAAGDTFTNFVTGQREGDAREGGREGGEYNAVISKFYKGGKPQVMQEL